MTQVANLTTQVTQLARATRLTWQTLPYLQVFQVGPHELEADGDPRRQSGRLQVLLELLVLPRIHERVGAQQRRKVGLKLKGETVNK